MRHIVLITAALCLPAMAALAQGLPAQTGPVNPAVKAMDQNNSSAPVAGKNSFTEAEAKSHIEAKGFTAVTRLKQDSEGVWRGMAKKHGHPVPVTLDYQGNVN